MRRRRFVKLLAAGAAAILTQPVEKTLAAPAVRAGASAAAHTVPPALRKEVANQKKSVADTLRVIRAYKLPAGSRPASVFRAERRGAPRGR